MAVDSEVRAFASMASRVRRSFSHGDVATNPGHVISLRKRGVFPAGTSVKVAVVGAAAGRRDSAFNFTCDGKRTTILNYALLS